MSIMDLVSLCVPVFHKLFVWTLWSMNLYYKSISLGNIGHVPYKILHLASDSSRIFETVFWLLYYNFQLPEVIRS